MPGRPLSRRTTLGSALAAPLVLAACDIDPPPSDPTSSATPEPPEDAELVATVVAALVRARGVLEEALSAAPDLAPVLAPVADAHAAHLDVLVGAVPDSEVPTAPRPSLPPRPAAVLANVQRSEQRLLRTARTGCLDARSGDLARVLASVAASTSQHAAALTGSAG
ncbi:hypothetical protein L2K70_06255 [Nocardioides KLBMP 9356]|uniref:DUF4439 domain-containing protein n=1 Tax=Nocardioides potassii TaxID=2911371 RepID=A0ABS9HB06_9ACTN|nr:hypothetical protein [Nocardioides potassii]MCF6377198.1 hypothetical protein [Nocardioides potassii]